MGDIWQLVGLKIWKVSMFRLSYCRITNVVIGKTVPKYVTWGFPLEILCAGLIANLGR